MYFSHKTKYFTICKSGNLHFAWYMDVHGRLHTKRKEKMQHLHIGSQSEAPGIRLAKSHPPQPFL
jgi:hypothetical protein